MVSKHIVFDVSSHGFGHFAQSAAVINALYDLHPEFRFTLRSRVPKQLAKQRINPEFSHIAHSTDFGMAMTSTLDVEREKSLSQYRELHRYLDGAIEEEAALLSELNADLLFSNVSYLSIAAGKKLGLPVAGLCSLNWADIFLGYFHDEEAQSIYAEMLDCYNLADVFICPERSMDMPRFHSIKHVSPLSLMGIRNKARLEEHFPIAKNRKVVLVTPGGIPTKICCDEWPVYDDVCFVIAWPDKNSRADIITLEELEISYIDVLASADAVLTKVGYGTVSEVLCHHIPTLYVRRNDWPEEPFLVEWLESAGKVKEVSRDMLFNGKVQPELDELLKLEWKKAAPLASGDKEAAQIIAALVS